MGMPWPDSPYNTNPPGAPLAASSPAGALHIMCAGIQLFPWNGIIVPLRTPPSLGTGLYQLAGQALVAPQPMRKVG